MSTAQINSVAGFVLLAIALTFLCYMLPTMIRSRQVVSDARVDDRFSTGLRVLARAGDTPPRYDSTARVYLHTPRAGQVEAPMDRQPQPFVPDSAAAARHAAAQRAARAAAASRRAAAARRRRALLLGLLLVSATFWTLFATIGFTIAPAIVATVLLVAATVAGRRAAVLAARAEERERATLPERPRLRTEAEQGSTTATDTGQQRHARSTGGPGATDAGEVDSGTTDTKTAAKADRPRTGPMRTSVAERTGSLRISVDPAESRDAGAEAGEGDSWTPVPVPKPTYTLKAPAPRRTVRAYEPPEWEPAPAPASAEEERHVTLAQVEQAIRERQNPQAPPATEAQVLAEQEQARAQGQATAGPPAHGGEERTAQPGPKDVAGEREAAENLLADAAGAEGLSAHAASGQGSPAAPGQGSSATPGQGSPAEVDHPKIDLQSVLERRRAVGQ